MAEKIFVVEDEDDIRELLEFNLRQEGFEVSSVARGDLAFDLIKKSKPDLILLDLMLPGMTGIEICKKVRTDSEMSAVPIIMVTAKDTESDIVVGLELGADDYIAKPFSTRELIARCKSVLRRNQSMTRQSPKDVFESGDLKVDLIGHQALLKGEKLPLTLTEFKLLKELLSCAGQVMTRRKLLGLVVGSDVTVTDRTIDVHLASLRKKMGDYGSRIETERGVGYRFKSES
jgi:DNA-binding response OmpR family regulator